MKMKLLFILILAALASTSWSAEICVEHLEKLQELAGMVSQRDSFAGDPSKQTILASLEEEIVGHRTTLEAALGTEVLEAQLTKLIGALPADFTSKQSPIKTGSTGRVPAVFTPEQQNKIEKLKSAIEWAQKADLGPKAALNESLKIRKLDAIDGFVFLLTEPELACAAVGSKCYRLQAVIDNAPADIFARVVTAGAPDAAKALLQHGKISKEAAEFRALTTAQYLPLTMDYIRSGYDLDHTELAKVLSIPGAEAHTTELFGLHPDVFNSQLFNELADGGNIDALLAAATLAPDKLQASSALGLAVFNNQEPLFDALLGMDDVNFDLSQKIGDRRLVAMAIDNRNLSILRKLVFAGIDLTADDKKLAGDAYRNTRNGSQEEKDVRAIQEFIDKNL